MGQLELTLENHLTISYEVEYTFITCHSIATPTDLPKRNKNTFTVKLVREFHSSFIPNVMERYTKIERNKLRIRATTQMYLRNLMLSEISPA